MLCTYFKFEILQDVSPRISTVSVHTVLVAIFIDLIQLDFSTTVLEEDGSSFQFPAAVQNNLNKSPQFSSATVNQYV